jgi:plastocyanin
MMTNQARKRLTLVALFITIAILSFAVLTQFEGRTNPPSGSSANLSSSTASSSTASSSTASAMLSRSTLSSTQQKSTSTSSSDGSTPLLMTFGQAYPELFATPSATLNYTINIRQVDATVSRVNLSAVSTVPGVTVTLSPKEFTFLGGYEGVTLGISVDPAVNSSIVPVKITATTATGVASASFDFTMDKTLAVVSVLVNGLVKPPTMDVDSGQTVRWLDLIQVDDDGNGPVTITLLDGSAVSPTLGEHDLWSHTFTRPGTYEYRVDAIGYTSSSGMVVVS